MNVKVLFCCRERRHELCSRHSELRSELEAKPLVKPLAPKAVKP